MTPRGLVSMLAQPTPLFPAHRWAHLTDSDRGWLAGLIDGEGCFHIHRTAKRKGAVPEGCMFKLGLRSDDAECLRHAKALIGLGTISVDRSPATAPTTVWQVKRKDECLAICDLLDPSGPGRLRSKKARDFDLWALAVDAWVARDLKHMDELDVALRAGRSYVAPVS